MAETLSPILGASIGGESPVQQNHWATSVADLAGGFAQSIKKQSASDLRNQQEEAAWSFFTQEINRAASVAQVEGDWDKSRRIRDSAVVKVTPYIDPSSGRAQSLIQATTGEDPTRFMSNPDLEVKNTLHNDELYASFYSQTDPNLPSNERESLAIASVARIKANEAAIAAARSNWNAEGTAAMLDLIKFGRERALRVYANNADPGANAAEDIRQARIGWEQIKAGMSRPAGITNEDWAPIQTELENTDRMLEQQETLLGLPALKNMNSTKSAEILQRIGELVGRNASNVSEFAIQATILSGDPNAIVSAIPSLVDNADFLNKINTADIASVGLRNEPEKIVDSIKANMEGATPKQKLEIATGMAGLVNGSDISNQIKSSPGALDTWSAGTLQSMVALGELTAGDTGAWIASTDYDSVFGRAFFNNLDAVAEVDPVVGAEIKVQALQALDAQGVQLEGLLIGMEQSGPFIWDRTEGTFRINPNPTGRMAKAFGQDIVGKAVDELYGGDVNAFVKDKGARVHRAAMGVGRPSTPPEGFEKDPLFLSDPAAYYQKIEGTDFRALSSELSNYFRAAAPANASKYAEALRKNDNIRDRLYVSAQTQAGQPANLPTEEVRGSFPGTTRPDNVINTSGSTFSRLMDKYEGGGDYNTLFGHSQNGGPFDGVKVTEMTLAEVLDFSNPKGQYGQWVKGQVGRVATPMGRFQIVGSTLREVANEMGLDLENTLFTEDVQNSIGNYIAQRAIRGKEGAAARKALRDTWEGFKNASDAELDAMAEEIRSGKAIFGPASTSTTRFGGARGLSGQRAEDLLPSAYGGALEMPQGGSESSSGGGGSSFSGEARGAGNRREGGPANAAAGAKDSGAKGSEKVASTEDAAAAADSKRVLDKLGLSEDTPVFKNWSEFQENIEDLPEGSVVVVNGRKITV